jgi:hypothetical protein
MEVVFLVTCGAQMVARDILFFGLSVLCLRVRSADRDTSLELLGLLGLEHR